MTPTAPRFGAKAVIGYVIVMIFAAACGCVAIRSAQGGELVCNRAENRCEIQNGWLIRERITFPADELAGAKSEYYVSMNRKIRSVYVTTRNDSFRLGGNDIHGEAQIIGAIDAFARKSGATTLDVRVEPDIGRYVLVAIIALIYGFVGVALIANVIRQRRESRGPSQT